MLNLKEDKSKTGTAHDLQRAKGGQENKSNPKRRPVAKLQKRGGKGPTGEESGTPQKPTTTKGKKKPKNERNKQQHTKPKRDSKRRTKSTTKIKPIY